jgi:hypothetical protein
VGVDRLTATATAVLVLALAGCDEDGRPTHLRYGESAAEFKPVPGSVVAIGRVVRGTTLGRRFFACRPPSAPEDALIVERIGVFGESLTFTNTRGSLLFACDGGIDAAGERAPPWCSGSAGRLVGGHLLDPRLDVGCRDRHGKAIAYAWVEPVAGAHWIGVDQGAYTEVYEALAGLPVRVATTRHIDLAGSRATFDLTQYDVTGRELIQSTIEVGVAG